MSRSGQTQELKRETFRTSRLLDFCSQKELVAQTGHAVAVWPLVALKELLDNAVDACEDAQVAPAIRVTVNASGLTVADNGPGIPAETVAGVLDFAVRVSSREAYVSPTRGAQGNALKTLLAMPFVLHGERGRVEIAARGLRHDITVRVDRIRQKAVIDHQTQKDRLVKTGTSVRLHWPDCASSLLTDSEQRFRQIAEDFTILNPHLTLTVDWFGKCTHHQAATKNWKKWLPGRPTNPHWYQAEHFERLVSACMAADAERDRERTVRELVAQFDGLTATAKQKAVLETTGLSRMNLSALRNGDGLDSEKTARLLAALKAQSKPVKPAALGVIGKEHLAVRFEALGAAMDTFKYRKVAGVTDALPWIVETAFAWRPAAQAQRLIIGVNWSPGLVNPFRALGRWGESLDAVLEQRRAGRAEPILLALHLACPRVEYTDRGKSAVVIGDTQRKEEEE
jgi:DNA topoisomerase VI subunit B